MLKKKKISIVINPISGLGKQKIIDDLLAKYLNTHFFQYSVTYSTAPNQITELAKNAVDQELDAFIVVGGDGSINEAAKGLVGSKTLLGIIPSGSGNGLARHLKIPLNLIDAIQNINAFNCTKIDTLAFNDEIVVNIAGIGFDANVAHEFSKYGKRGFLSYIKLVISELTKYKNQKIILKTDERIFDREIFLMSFANGSQYGNNAVIAPKANIKDGMMDVVILKKLSVLGIVKIAYQLFKGNIKNSKYIEVIKTKKAEIMQQYAKAHIDGEPILSGNKIIVSVQPLSLNIITP